MDYILGLFTALCGALVFYAGFHKMHQFRVIKNTPRSKVRSLAIGLVEIHGSVRADECLIAPFSGNECVFYRYRVEEYRRSTTTSKGKTRTTHKWVTIAYGEQKIPFFAEDETGKVLVNPEGAEFEVSVDHSFAQKKAGLFDISRASSSQLKSALKGYVASDETAISKVKAWNLESVEEKSFFSSSRVGDRKFYESLVVPDDVLFVLGTAANQSDAPDNLIIKKGKNEKIFIISDKSEKNVLKSIRNGMIAGFVFGSIFFIAGVLLTLHLAGAF